MTTRNEWAVAVLSALGNSSPDAQTVNLLSAWSACEFDSRQEKAAAFNPLATKQPMPGATNYNSVGVKNYPDSATGLDATVRTIRNGHYPHILEGLRTNKPEIALNYTELGIWGTGGGCVERIWRNNDVRNQNLPSYDPNVIGIKTGGTITLPKVSPSGEAKATPDSTGSMPSVESGASVQSVLDYGDPSQYIARAILGGIGSVLILVAVILTVRTYVPTKQIVRTIEAAA